MSDLKTEENGVSQNSNPPLQTQKRFSFRVFIEDGFNNNMLNKKEENFGDTVYFEHTIFP